MSDVRTVITAAGDSRSLFLAGGFGVPKSLVPWKGEPVLARAIEAYAMDKTRTVVAVNANEDREWNLTACIRDWHPQVSTCTVNSHVQGALASALIALTDARPDQPLVVAAGDSMISGGIRQHVAHFMQVGCEAATIAFPSTEPRWSYLSVDESGAVSQVAEKKVIGPLATTGVFYYKSVQLFLDAATWCLVNNAQHNGSFYVSTTLNYMISRGSSVAYTTIERSRYQTWSLPVDFSS